MSNIVTHQTGTGEPHSSNHGLAAAELAIKQVDNNYDNSSSGKLYYGENTTDTDSTSSTVRAFGIGTKADNGTGQSGVPIGGNLYFKDGTNIGVTQATSGDVTTLTFALDIDSAISKSSGDLTIDAEAGDIILDAHGAEVYMRNGTNSSNYNNVLSGSVYGSLDIFGTITNQHTISNNGRINIKSTGLLNNNLTLTNDSLLIVLGTMKNYKTATLTNNDSLKNYKTLLNYGLLFNF